MEIDKVGESSTPLHSFQQFAQALSACKSLPPSSLLDQTEGLALLFADACHYRAEAGTDPLDDLLGDEGNDESDTVDWRLEEQTWRILHLLHAERHQRLASRGEAVASSSKSSDNPYQTPFSAVQDILDDDASLNELKVRSYLRFAPP